MKNYIIVYYPKKAFEYSTTIEWAKTYRQAKTKALEQLEVIGNTFKSAEIFQLDKSTIFMLCEIKLVSTVDKEGVSDCFLFRFPEEAKEWENKIDREKQRDDDWFHEILRH